MLLKLVWKSKFFTIQEKQKLLQRERSIEFGDVDDIENYGVQASLSEEDMKLQLFNDYIKPNTQFNPKKLEASAKFFYEFGNRT